LVVVAVVRGLVVALPLTAELVTAAVTAAAAVAITGVLLIILAVQELPAKVMAAVRVQTRHPPMALVEAAALPLLVVMDHLRLQAMAVLALHQQSLDQASLTAAVVVAALSAPAALAALAAAGVAHPVEMAQPRLQTLEVVVADLALAHLGLAALAAPASSS
jgi:hypothetical protein